jgi:hypothetical protein
MTSSQRFDIVEPNAGSISASMRAFGYSPETAIADLVDNSITAGAKSIAVNFDWDGTHSWISVTDDGKGMSTTELVNAMRLGSQSPLDDRDPSDLGRFGLGLKTASISQCRKVTVITKALGSKIACRCWDLDVLDRTGEWRLLHDPSPVAEVLIDSLKKSKHGTVVIWEVLDRLVGECDRYDETAQKQFLTVADRVSEHLSMTFHRFISSSRISLKVNDHPVEIWDPFLEIRNLGAQRMPENSLELSKSKVRVRPFVLPHRSKLTEDDFTKAGAKRGWNDLQGFYVYRNDRLLVAGSWLELGFTKEEHYKLARIAIDIPNDMDSEWQIDVRKSLAIPPREIREKLTKIAKSVRAKAVEVYRHRGKVVTEAREKDGVTLLWNQKVARGLISYQINRDHAVVQAALNSPSKKSLNALLRLVEETIPVPQITISNAENPEKHAHAFEGKTTTQVKSMAEDLYRVLRHDGLPHEGAARRVLSMDPFDRFKDDLAPLLAALEDNAK